MRILHSNIIGEAEKELIILHGFLGMGDNWKTLSKKWASVGFRVHLIDQRNHGRSFWNKVFNYKVLAQDLMIYMDKKNIKNTILIGHSMGGKTAMEFSIKFPERIRKLVVIDISPKKYVSNHDKILAGLASFNFRIIKTRKEADNHLSKYVTEIQVRQFLLKNLYWITQDRLALRLNISVLKNSSEEISKEIELKKKYNNYALFVKGENSDYIVDEDLKLISKYFPKSKVKKIKNAGHWVHVENQKDFIHTINTFLHT